MIWTKEQARNYLVSYHFINTDQSLSIEDVFDRIQSIQYDPLNVVGSNSDLVLQARIKGYQKEMLQEALYTHRTLVDGWDKQMSIYQTKYFPYFKRVRDNRSQGSLNSYMHHRGLNPEEYLDDVMRIIAEDGPIFSSQIKLGDSVKNVWGGSKPSSASIDYLFHKGLIGINSRKNTQKKFDLIGRLIENFNHDEPIIDEEEFIDWLLLRRIKSLGLCWNKSSVAFSGIHIYKKGVRTKHLKRLLEKDLIKEITVESIKDPLYVPAEALKYKVQVKDRISFIAPLDNIIWDRALMNQLFDFEYTWEVYVPKAKRKWGYYVLPILRGSRMIGRIEFEKQRKADPLTVISVVYEKNIKETKVLDSKLQGALNRFAKYLGAEEVIR